MCFHRRYLRRRPRRCRFVAPTTAALLTSVSSTARCPTTAAWRPLPDARCWKPSDSLTVPRTLSLLSALRLFRCSRLHSLRLSRRSRPSFLRLSRRSRPSDSLAALVPRTLKTLSALRLSCFSRTSDFLFALVPQTLPQVHAVRHHLQAPPSSGSRHQQPRCYAGALIDARSPGCCCVPLTPSPLLPISLYSWTAMGRIHWCPAGGLDLPIGLQGGDLPGPREHKEDTVFDRTQRFTLLVDDVVHSLWHALILTGFRLMEGGCPPPARPRTWRCTREGCPPPGAAPPRGSSPRQHK